MYKVLDKNDKKIITDKVDARIHRHISGREFTKDEFPAKVIKPTITKTVEKKVITPKTK